MKIKLGTFEFEIEQDTLITAIGIIALIVIAIVGNWK
jgi:hypothetical protein